MMQKQKNFYKAIEPYQTIQNIRNILFGADIFLMELSASHDSFYHSHVKIATNGLDKLEIQTNGKGRNFAYSLASAYAEMMERMQNNYIFEYKHFSLNSFIRTLPAESYFRKKLEEKDLAFDFLAYPDEKLLSWGELLADETEPFYKSLLQNATYLVENYPLDKK